ALAPLRAPRWERMPEWRSVALFVLPKSKTELDGGPSAAGMCRGSGGAVVAPHAAHERGLPAGASLSSARSVEAETAPPPPRTDAATTGRSDLVVEPADAAAGCRLAVAAGAAVAHDGGGVADGQQGARLADALFAEHVGGAELLGEAALVHAD